MVKRYNKEECAKMYSLVQQWYESGMSQKAYAESIGLKNYVLRYWIRKHDRYTQKESDFILLQDFDKESKEIIITYPNGIELKLPGNFSVEAIKALTQV